MFCKLFKSSYRHKTTSDCAKKAPNQGCKFSAWLLPQARTWLLDCQELSAAALAGWVVGPLALRRLGLLSCPSLTHSLDISESGSHTVVDTQESEKIV